MSEKSTDNNPDQDDAKPSFDLETPPKNSKYKKTVIWTFCITPVLYIVVISTVLIKPEVMTMVGLRPFIDYLMYEVQTDGHL